MCSLFRRALSSTIDTEPLRSIRNHATLPSIIHPNGTILSGDFFPRAAPPHRAAPNHPPCNSPIPTELLRNIYAFAAHFLPSGFATLSPPPLAPAELLCCISQLPPVSYATSSLSLPHPCRATSPTFSANNDIAQRLIPSHRRRCSLSYAPFFKGPQSFIPTCSIFSTYLPDHLSIPSVQIL